MGTEFRTAGQAEQVAAAIAEGEYRAGLVREVARRRRCAACGLPMVVAPASWTTHLACRPTNSSPDNKECLGL